ncbi:MAG: protoheme IX farnesyltransferase [Pseudobacteriovorax sp.]|nr:protoheme IX farnesyltransferase [Pseudobacteriovorax sp.]
MSFQNIGLASALGLRAQALFSMTKPTISLLVIVTMVPSLLISSGGALDLSVALIALFGTFAASASAGIFNHLVDSDLDHNMERTRKRPLQAGVVNNRSAFVAATSLAVLSFWLLFHFTTPLAALIALAANVFYVVFYTMYLKKRTIQNIVIGGAAGAVGPMIGSAAVTGRVDLLACILFLIIFLWTPPHFWALAIKYRDDYARANIPMLPSVKGIPATTIQIFIYTLTLIPSVLLVSFMGYGGMIYWIPTLLITLTFAYLAFRLQVSQDEKKAMPLFIFSCFYLFAVFGFLTLDAMIKIL